MITYIALVMYISMCGFLSRYDTLLLATRLRNNVVIEPGV